MARVRAVLPSYPDIKVEIIIDNGLVDIVAGRYDDGVRIGDIVAKDIIAIPIGPPMRMVAVAAPSYFATRPKPKTPNDLTAHTCISIRLPPHGGLYAWEFEKAGREFRARVDGQLVFNSITQILQAALDGFGIAYVADALVQPHLESGRLVSVLPEPASAHAGVWSARRGAPLSDAEESAA